MQIFNKLVALHYTTKELPLTKQVKSMIHMIMSQEITIAILKLVTMQTVEGVANGKLTFSIS
jgi:hypothetical protein